MDILSLRGGSHASKMTTPTTYSMSCVYTLGRNVQCASICAAELTPDDNISRTPFCQQNVIQKCRERTREEFVVVIIHWCALMLFFTHYWIVHAVQGIGAAFIVTEILIPSMSRAVYLLWVFMYLSSGWLDEGGKKA